MDKKEVLKYWIESSENDFSAMDHLFEKGDYSWSLFIGHLVIEKLLKSLYIQNVDITPPFIHDLVRLSEKVGLSLQRSKRYLRYASSHFTLPVATHIADPYSTFDGRRS